MKELEKEFIYKGDTFTQLDKSDSGYIYLRMHENTPYYEVFGIKVSEILEDFENKTGSGEFKHRYPRDNDFGVWAWCFKNKEAAIRKFDSLTD